MPPASPVRPAVAHRFQLMLLRSPFRRLFGGLCELRYVGRVSGRTITLPVQYARDGDRLVVYVGGAAGKQWWRNFTDDRDVDVHVGGVDFRGSGHVVDRSHPDRAWAEEAYRRRFRRVTLVPADPMVVIDLAAFPSPATAPGAVSTVGSAATPAANTAETPTDG